MALANGSTTRACGLERNVARPDADGEWRNLSGTTIHSAPRAIQLPTLGQARATVGTWCLWRSDGDSLFFRLQTPETTSRAAAVAHNVLSAAECHGAGFASSHAAGHSSSGRSHGWPVSLPRQYSRRGAHAIWCTGVRTAYSSRMRCYSCHSNGTRALCGCVQAPNCSAQMLWGVRSCRFIGCGAATNQWERRTAPTEHRHGRKSVSAKLKSAWKKRA